MIKVINSEKLKDYEKLENLIFCSNHLKPSNFFASIGFPYDFIILKKVIKRRINIVYQVDLPDYFIPNNLLNRLFYEIHAFLMLIIKNLFVKGFGFYLNKNLQMENEKRNFKTSRFLLESLKYYNLLMFPYGFWFNPDEQDFLECNDLDGDKFILKTSEHYKKSLKSGFAIFSLISKKSIVPVYITRKCNDYFVAIGNIINGQTKTEIAKKYLSEMRRLKEITKS